MKYIEVSIFIILLYWDYNYNNYYQLYIEYIPNTILYSIEIKFKML